MSFIIDSDEERDVAVIDIPNAFIQTQVEDKKDIFFIHILGVMVDIMVEMSRDVCNLLVTTDKKGVKQLLV